MATVGDESDGASDTIEVNEVVTPIDGEETLTIQTQAVAREQMISWQVWQP